MNIGLALSGGGFRATVFHLGVLARLAKEDRLEEVSFLSTVSGGSLCAGLVYALSGYHWPGSGEFLQSVLPDSRQTLTTKGLQASLIRRIFTNPLGFLENRADDLSQLLQERWEITAKLSELGPAPRWMINATCFETGANWRFERFRMGDYIFGYTNDTSIPLSDALAASAGYPGLIGSLKLNTADSSWFRYVPSDSVGELPPSPGSPLIQATEPIEPLFDQVHLWDGGVYDNLGIEALHSFRRGWREGVDFLLSSDASGRPGIQTFRIGSKALYRIIDIQSGQIRSLRVRAILARMINHQDPGAYLRIGTPCEKILKSAGKEAEIPAICPGSLPPEEAARAEQMPTVIRVLTEEEFERLFRHGFEVADQTLYGFHEDQFSHIGYGNL